MDAKEFITQLNNIQELMQNENYKQAIILLEKLKELDKNADFDYNLSHKLYQLDSNTRSLYNQQIILTNIKELSNKYRSIRFQELNQILRANNELNLTDDILRREIELLILRNQLHGKIEKDSIVLNSK
jgi:hypothetical protein